MSRPNNKNKKIISKVLVATCLCTLLNQVIVDNRVCAENMNVQKNIENSLLNVKENIVPGAVEENQPIKENIKHDSEEQVKEETAPVEEKIEGKEPVTTQEKTEVPKESTTPGAVTVPEVEKIPVSQEIPAVKEIPVTITAGKALGRPSKTEVQSKVKIPFSVDKETFEKRFTTYTFDIVYDSSKLENIAVDAYEGIAKANIGSPIACGDSKMKVTVSWKGVLPEESYDVKNGVLFKVNFDIKPAFNSGETPIEIMNGKVIFSSVVETDTIVAHNGKVLFGMYGDINEDGCLNSRDINLLKRKIRGKLKNTKMAEDKEAVKMASDVNEDGKIDMEDLKVLVNSVFGSKN